MRQLLFALAFVLGMVPALPATAGAPDGGVALTAAQAADRDGLPCEGCTVGPCVAGHAACGSLVLGVGGGGVTAAAGPRPTAWATRRLRGAAIDIAPPIPKPVLR